MAGNFENTLYPPIIDTFMPAFDITEAEEKGVKVYFSLSSYNSLSDIYGIHVSLVSMDTNKSVLSNPEVPFLFRLVPDDLEDDDELSEEGAIEKRVNRDPDNGKLFFRIYTNELASNWLPDVVYKLQIRFDKVSQTKSWPETEGNADKYNYFINNLAYFSEWSSVCLLRPINKPVIGLVRFFDGTNKLRPNYNRGVIPLSGSAIFEGNTDTLQSFEFSLYKQEDYDISNKTPIREPLIKDNVVYTAAQINPNEIYHEIDTTSISAIEETFNFVLVIDYTTKKQYKGTDYFEFTINDYLVEADFNPTISVELDEDNFIGMAKLHITNSNSVFGVLRIRRSSSLSQFKIWEPIFAKNVTGAIDLTINDNTIGSMIWYRYSVQFENTSGQTTRMYMSEKFMSDFYDAILSREDKQFSIKYNYKISSVKPIVTRTKVDTLGSRYPKFAENAVLNYKQFSISGLITIQEDQEQLFLNRAEHINDSLTYEYYENYNLNIQEPHRNFSKESIDMYDHYWEREFREKLVAWLNDGEPKLYRSKTEGNLCVMITDISLTPNETLGRMIYDFSATMYEVADGYDLSVIDSLGIYNVQKVNSLISSGGSGGGSGEGDTTNLQTIETLYQLYNIKASDIKVGTSNPVYGLAAYLENQLNLKYGGITREVSGRILMYNVKVYFNNPPHKITLSDGVDRSGYYLNVKTTESSIPVNLYVNESGYYEFPDDIVLTDINFFNKAISDNDNQTEGGNTDDLVSIQCLIKFNLTPSSGSTIDTVETLKNLVGQYSTNLQPDVSFYKEIAEQHHYNEYDSHSISTGEGENSITYKKSEVSLQRWRGVSIESSQYSIFDVKWEDENEYTEIMIGNTGRLDLLQDVIIEDIIYRGIRLIKNNNNSISSDMLREYEYTKDNIEYELTNQITNPKVRTVYNIDGEDQIYYSDGGWYPFEEDGSGEFGLAKVPAYSYIYYKGTLTKLTYG